LIPYRGDMIAVGLLVASLGFFLFVMIVSSGISLPFNFGFGSEMECHNVGYGDPVCTKRLGP